MAVGTDAGDSFDAAPLAVAVVGDAADAAADEK